MKYTILLILAISTNAFYGMELRSGTIITTNQEKKQNFQELNTLLSDNNIFPAMYKLAELYKKYPEETLKKYETRYEFPLNTLGNLYVLDKRLADAELIFSLTAAAGSSMGIHNLIVVRQQLKTTIPQK